MTAPEPRSEPKGELRFLLKHSAVYGVGNLLSRAVGFILLPLYTRHLTATHYGILELVDVTSGLVGIVIGLGIASAVSRFYYDSAEEKNRRRVVSTAYWVTGGVSVMAVLLAAAFAVPLAGLALDSQARYPLLLVSFASLAVGVIQDLGQIYLRLQYRSVAFNVISVLSLVLGVVLNVLFIAVFHWGVLGILVSSLLTRLAVAIPLTGWVLSRSGLGFDWGLARQMIRFGAPLIPSSLATTLVNYSDRYFLKHFATIADAGLWGLANKLGTSIHLLITSPFIMTFLPRRFEIVNRPDARETFARVAEYFFLALVTCGLLVVLFVDEILRILTTPEYYVAGALVPWVVLTMVLLGMKYHFEFGILYQKKTHYYAAINVTTAILHLTLNFLLVRAYGIRGAALASVGSFSFNSIAVYTVGRALYPIPFAIDRKLRVIAVATLLFLTSRAIDLPSLVSTVAFKVALLLAYPALLVLVRAVSTEDVARVRGFLVRRLRRGEA